MIPFSSSQDVNCPSGVTSSDVELNQGSKASSRHSSCTSLNSAKVHPEMTSDSKPPTPVECTISEVTCPEDSSDRGSIGEVQEPSETRTDKSAHEAPTYKLYAMSVSNN